MPINRLTPAALFQLGRLQNGEHIIDGAPARCRELDERNLATFEQAGGGTAGLKLLEADLVVTNRALCYVAYHLQMASIAEWEVLCGVETAKPKRLFSVLAPLTVVYRTGRRQDFQVSRGAVKPIARHVLQQLAIDSGHADQPTASAE